MKIHNLKLLAVIGLTSIMGVGLAACSDDDGPDSGSSKGKCDAKLGSDDLGTRYGYYSLDIEDDAPGDMTYAGLFFFNYDLDKFLENPSKLPKTGSHVIIDYLVPDDQKEITTITVLAGS